MKWLMIAALLLIVVAAVKAQTTQGVVVGAVAPDFSALNSAGLTNLLSDFRGKWLVLYFYPKAFTPGCTAEACSLRDGHANLNKLNAVVLGVSLDPVGKLAKFKEAYHLPFELLSDESKAISRAYDSLMLGGFVSKRRTFIINPEGRIAHIFNSVKTGSHEQEVAAVLERLQAQGSPTGKGPKT